MEVRGETDGRRATASGKSTMKAVMAGSVGITVRRPGQGRSARAPTSVWKCHEADYTVRLSV